MTREDFQLVSNGASTYERCAARFMPPFVDALVSSLALNPTDVVADVACGTGFVARKAVSAVNNPAQIIGLDLNEGMLALAQQLEPTIHWKRAPADALGLDDDSVDAIAVQQGMQFFPDVAAAAREFARVAKPDARIGATVWSDLVSCPYFAAQSGALSKHINEQSGAAVSKAVPVAGDDLIASALESVGFTSINRTVVSAVVSLGDIGSYVVEQIAATPWGPDFAGASADDQLAFRNHMVEALRRYEDGNGNSQVPFASHLVTATWPG